MGLSRQSATSAATTRSSTSSDWHVCRAAGELTRDVGGIQKDTFRVCEKSATMVSRWPDGQTGNKDEEALFEKRRHCVWHCRVGGRAGSRARGQAKFDGAAKRAPSGVWHLTERNVACAGRPGFLSNVSASGPDEDFRTRFGIVDGRGLVLPREGQFLV